MSLDNFIQKSALVILEDQLAETHSDIQRIRIIELFLIARLRAPKTDHLIAAAIAMIYQFNGNIRISDLALSLHISQSPLEKRFRKVVGTSPKKFANLIRLKHSIAQFRPQTPLTELAYQSAFYDQAHFIKEFKTYTDETPERFFNQK